MLMMKKNELFAFCMNTLFAGLAIGLGGSASLLANSLLPGLAGKIVGAALFSLGIFLVISLKMKLFTGMVAGIPTMGVKNLWQLAVCFLGNALGIGLVALVVRLSFLGDTVSA